MCVQSLSLLSSLYVSNLIIFWLFFVMLCLYNLLSLHSITNEWVKKLSNCMWYKSLLFLLSSSLRHQKLVQTIYLFFWVKSKVNQILIVWKMWKYYYFIAKSHIYFYLFLSHDPKFFNYFIFVRQDMTSPARTNLYLIFETFFFFIHAQFGRANKLPVYVFKSNDRLECIFRNFSQKVHT